MSTLRVELTGEQFLDFVWNNSPSITDRCYYGESDSFSGHEGWTVVSANSFLIWAMEGVKVTITEEDAKKLVYPIPPITEALEELCAPPYEVGDWVLTHDLCSRVSIFARVEATFRDGAYVRKGDGLRLYRRFSELEIVE